MLIIKLAGGLGNQMFQYAFGRALSIRNNDRLKLDLSFLHKDVPGVTKREYELDVFNIKAQPATEAEIEKLTIQNTWLNKILQRARLLDFINQKQIIERGFNFQPAVFKKSGDLYIVGYWQSEKYFKDYEHQIRQEFTLKPELMAGLDSGWSKKIGESNSVSLHIRRGDYVKNKKINQTHGACGLDYYKTGMELIASKTGDPEFFVFSDDLNWCRENINSNFPLHFVAGSKNYQDMILMSRCRHNIIANSSFSWWGAWLNQNPDKIVVAPAKWFNITSLDISDLIPKSWITLQAV